MASREEEKRKRREEREALQRKEAAAAARAKRLQLVLATLLGLAVIGAGVFAITQTGGGEGEGETKEGVTEVPVPKVGPTDLQAAAKAAGCRLIDPPNEGSTHVEGKVQYKSNPATSGNHSPTPASDGAYAPGSEPAPENLVHSLEHGRVHITYEPGTPANRIAQLESLALEPFNGAEDYHTLVYQNNTKMKYAVAVVAWDHLMGCTTLKDEFFNAARAFRRQWTDKAPELIPQRQ